MTKLVKGFFVNIESGWLIDLDLDLDPSQAKKFASAVSGWYEYKDPNSDKNIRKSVYRCYIIDIPIKQYKAKAKLASQVYRTRGWCLVESRNTDYSGRIRVKLYDPITKGQPFLRSESSAFGRNNHLK